jgi:serine/threonine protein kinase
VAGKALRTLGNYEILDKLGAGGMGEVWRAHDRRLQRLVALKILPQEVAGDPVRRARFELEARALGALNHPNVVAIYDVGEDGGRAYIVYELVEGEPLRAALEWAWKTIRPSQPVLEIHDLHVTPDGQAYAYNYVTAQSDLYTAHGLN